MHFETPIAIIFVLMFSMILFTAIRIYRYFKN